MEREPERQHDDATKEPGDEGHGFAETLPADGAGWERALEPDEHPAARSDDEPEPQRAP